MPLRAASPILRELRRYSSHTNRGPSDKVGSAIAIGYFCAVVSAPFVGAFIVSKRAAKDQRYASMRPLGFRNCLPGSSLEDYAGVLGMRRK